MLRLYFLHRIIHYSDIFRTNLDHLQGLTGRQQSRYKNADELLNTLKFVHKISEDIIKLICNSVKLVHKMGGGSFWGFLRGTCFLSGGCKVFFFW